MNDGTLIPQATDWPQVMAAWYANEAARPRWLHPNVAAIFRDQRGFFGGGRSPAPPPPPPPPPPPDNTEAQAAAAKAAAALRRRRGRQSTILAGASDRGLTTNPGGSPLISSQDVRRATLG